MNISSTIMKATMLSTTIFWLVIFSEDFQEEMFPFVLISIIPISICCALTIFITIVPFFSCINKIEITNIYKKYFPFYAIVIFCLCFYGIWESHFNVYPISFFVSAFFTCMQSWTWIVKDNMLPETQSKQ